LLASLLTPLTPRARRGRYRRSANGHRITVAGGLVRLQLITNHGAAFGLARAIR
jgi:hypothetical protein